jgi:hypothetical protein
MQDNSLSYHWKLDSLIFSIQNSRWAFKFEKRQHKLHNLSIDLHWSYRYGTYGIWKVTCWATHRNLNHPICIYRKYSMNFQSLKVNQINRAFSEKKSNRPGLSPGLCGREPGCPFGGLLASALSQRVMRPSDPDRTVQMHPGRRRP